MLYEVESECAFFIYKVIKVIKVITTFSLPRYAIFDLPDAFNQMGIDLYGR